MGVMVKLSMYVRGNARWVVAFGLALSLALVAPPEAAEAQRRKKDEKEKPQGRRTFAMTPKFSKRIEHVLALITDEEKYAEARQALDLMLRAKKLNPLEQATIYKFYGFTYTNEENYADAIPWFEKALETGGLDPAAHNGLLFSLAQLQMMEGNYAKTVDILNQWFELAEKPTPDAYYYLAIAYHQQQKVEEALPPAEQAVAISTKPRESWMQLLLALYFEKGDYAKMLPLLEQMVKSYPKKAYWMQLSAIYAELEEEAKSMAVYQLAFIDGYLDKDQEIQRLARMYMFNDIPYYAATVLQDGIDNEVVEGDVESYELLANSWITAREFDRAVEPMKMAAEMADNGDLYTRLAQIYLEREDWNLAQDSIASAVRKGSLKNPGRAHLLLGICNFNLDRFDAAEASFKRAGRHEKIEPLAKAWLAHVAQTRLAKES